MPKWRRRRHARIRRAIRKMTAKLHASMKAFVARHPELVQK